MDQVLQESKVFIIKQHEIYPDPYLNKAILKAIFKIQSYNQKLCQKTSLFLKRVCDQDLL